MKIGIYRACGIGDVVQLTPLFQQIRADFPRAHLAFFTSANVAGIVPGCPWLDQVEYFAPEVLSSAMGQWGGFPIWRKVANAGRWDFFLDLDPRWRHSAAFPLVRAQHKGGVQTAGWKPFQLFDEFLTLHPAGLDRGHSAGRYLELWQKLSGCDDRGFGYSLQFPPTDSFPVQVPARAVCLVPGAGNMITPGDAKRWPLERWLRLAGRLSAEGYNPLWLGSAQDRHDFPIPAAEQNHMGKLDLRDTWEIIDRSEALIGNDSGLFHMALASRARAIGLFGPTNPQRTGPFRHPENLVLKAGLGVVNAALLAAEPDESIRAGLDHQTPMDTLEYDVVAREVIAFLSNPTRS